jgi:outer membrane protein TolC
MRKNIILLLVVFTISTGLYAQEFRTDNLTAINVGIAIDGEWRRNVEYLNILYKEVSDLLGNDFDIRFPKTKQIVGNWTYKSIKMAIDSLQSDNEVDILLVPGPIGSDYVCQKDSLPKPVIAGFVVNIELQDIPYNGRSSGKSNLCYIASSHNPAHALETIGSMIQFKKIVYVFDKNLFLALPELFQNIETYISGKGYIYDFVLADSSVSDIINKIPDDADVVYVGIMFNFNQNQIIDLAKNFKERGLPSFAFMGNRDVERGIMAGVGSGIDFVKLSRRIALNIQRILLGENAGEIPVAFSTDKDLYVNISTCRKVNVYPSWEILTEAKLVSEERTDIGRVVNLRNAVARALDANLDYIAKQKYVDAGHSEVGKARSNLLPQIDIAATGVIVDKDRAEASRGNTAERTITGSAGLTQVLYSEEAWANLSIQKYLQKSREGELEELRLDIIKDAATAYLNLLSAKTIEKIQQNNLRLTRTNLEFARNREIIGVSGPGEGYRFENQLASNRIDVVAAQSTRNIAEMQLNRLLHYPSEDPFLTEEADLDDFEVISSERMQRYLGNKWTFKIFRKFTVKAALRNSPELSQIEALIAAQKRALSSAKRVVFGIPTLALSGNVEKKFSEEGAGADVYIAPPADDDVNWSVGFNLSIPLFSGGYKLSAYSQAKTELRQLEIQKASIEEKIEQNTRAALHTAGASYAAIGFSRDAAEVARKNLELVSDSYQRGVASILDLLDAQNTALVSEQQAANAIFNFYADMMRVQRAAGIFVFMLSEDEQMKLRQELDEYFKKAGF